MRFFRVRHSSQPTHSGESARKVNAFMGGKLDEAAMLAAVDRSLYRNKA
jgi:hypothetical protein